MTEQLTLQFTKPFSLDKYELFLKAKLLPEKQLKYDWKKGIIGKKYQTQKRQTEQLKLGN